MDSLANLFPAMLDPAVVSVRVPCPGITVFHRVFHGPVQPVSVTMSQPWILDRNRHCDPMGTCLCDGAEFGHVPGIQPVQAGLGCIANHHPRTSARHAPPSPPTLPTPPINRSADRRVPWRLGSHHAEGVRSALDRAHGHASLDFTGLCWHRLSLGHPTPLP